MRITALTPAYIALVSAIEAYCIRTRTPAPTLDCARAELVNMSSAMLSKVRLGRIRVSEPMALRISAMLCVDEDARTALKTALRGPIETSEDNDPPEIAFVRKFGVNDSVLLVEFHDLWPFSYGFETPTSPMSLAFKEGMDAGMSVILFVPYRIRSRTGPISQSMGDGFTDHEARTTLTHLAKLNADRVALYHLVENPCPTPRVGIRLTGLLPHEAPESRWWIANRPHAWHFVPTSRCPEDFLDFFLGRGALRHGGTLPTPEELEDTWRDWRRSRELPDDRPCPIQRWIE
jgi:hypothetical protein